MTSEPFMDIVFVDTPIFQSNGEAIFIQDHLPNIGLAILAAVAEREGFKASILDAVALKYSFQEIIENIIKKKPKYVGLSAMTHSISSVAMVAKKLKEKISDVTIILGGVHVTSTPKQTFLKFPDCFDIAVIGEGEITLIELLNVLESHRDLSEIAGLAFMHEGAFFQTGSRAFIRDLDELPMPAWHLFPPLDIHYSASFISSGSRKKSGHLITSRGCPGQCVFCDNSVNGRKMRAYSVDYVIEMIEILHKKHNINDIQFNDDTFVTLRKRLLEVCERLIQRNYDLTWSCDARVNSVTPESIKNMKRAGCWQIAYGVESGSERILQFLKKKITLDQIKNAFTWTKKAGISTKGFFILGHPTETHESINDTINLMLALRIDVVGMTFFTAYPGSPIHSSIKNYGSFNPNWEFANTYSVGNFIPDGFTDEELLQYRKKALKKFYLRPKYILGQLGNINNLSDFQKLTQGAFKVVQKYLF